MFKHNWRLVCHACGKKYPVAAAVSVRFADCCLNPRVHHHNIDAPCERCA